MQPDWKAIARRATGRDDIAGSGRYAVVRTRVPDARPRINYAVTLHTDRVDAEATAEFAGRDGTPIEILDLRSKRDAHADASL
jgi:hypothetical protein